MIIDGASPNDYIKIPQFENDVNYLNIVKDFIDKEMYYFNEIYSNKKKCTEVKIYTVSYQWMTNQNSHFLNSWHGPKR